MFKFFFKNIWGIDSEGIVVDKDGNFWVCEEGGPTIWKLNSLGKVLKRYTPYANLPGAQPEDVAIDTVFKYRKNNRGFEGITITPNGKVYAIIQSPILYPSKSVGENTQVHRIVEIDPVNNTTKMYAYLNDSIIGSSGSNQIRLRDWKIGDMAAINDTTFLVIEAAQRGSTDIKRVYKININGATAVTSGLYGGVTLEALVNKAGLTAQSIVPVKKTLFMDLLANGWPGTLDKAEGLAIINDSTIAIGNDNDYGQTTLNGAEDGVAVATGKLSHVVVYRLSGVKKLVNFVPLSSNVSQGTSAANSSKSPYMIPSVQGASFTSILTAGDVVNGYKMVGLGDGIGAFDNNNGTFTLLLNHEIGSSSGVVRVHGQKGAFVSKWIINKNNLSVVSGADLIQTVKLWNGSAYAVNTTTLSAMNRLCSADLPSVYAFYNPASGLGTQTKIFLSGEEAGNEGRVFAHIASGTEAGVSYELPRLGKLSWENGLACPGSGDKTLVIGLDDQTPGQVYAYVGTKAAYGNDIEKAGLTQGVLYGIAVSGMPVETNTFVPTANTTFSLVSLGNVENTTGATLNTNSNNAGVTNFLRPEDGAWDPSHPNDFYFVTTNSFSSPSRMWKLTFTDIKNPELGGTITAVLDGTEGQKMMDNLTIDHSGHILIQEDPGNQSYIAKIWEYNTTTDVLVEVAKHDPDYFSSGSSNFLTQDEESSGIIDVQHILGAGKFLLYQQAHYNIGNTELVEGGQLLMFYNPNTASSSSQIKVKGNGVLIGNGDITPSSVDNTDMGAATIGAMVSKTITIENSGNAVLYVSGVYFGGLNPSEFSVSGASSFSIAAGSSHTLTVNFSPLYTGARSAKLYVMSNDYSNTSYVIKMQGIGYVLTGISGIDAEDNIVIYPNPAHDKTTVVWNKNEEMDAEVVVYDIQGSVVKKPVLHKFSSADNKLDIVTSDLTGGIYFISIKTSALNHQLKMIVNH